MLKRSLLLLTLSLAVAGPSFSQDAAAKNRRAAAKKSPSIAQESQNDDREDDSLGIARLQAAAHADAEYAWGKFQLRPGEDGHFNGFEIGMRISDAEQTFHARRGLAKDSAQAKAYDEAFRAAFIGIARSIESEREL